MNRRLRGWTEIGLYLGVSARTAQRRQSIEGIPVHREGKGPRARVCAFAEELDRWNDARQRGAPPSGSDVSDEVLHRIHELSLAGNLYRRNFRLRFALRRLGTGVRAAVETEYEIVNEGAERQPYTQEVTINHNEQGCVESMSVLADGKPIYRLSRPAITECLQGYVAYRGRTIFIDPVTAGRRFSGEAAWVVNRAERDFWYLHMGIPTLGVTVETSAPPDFEITPSFSTTRLYLKSEHIDIAWQRRQGR